MRLSVKFMFTEFTQWSTWRKGLEIYSANLGINVGAHLSFLVVITWCVTTLGHDQRCACGLWQDNNTYKIKYIPSIVVKNRHSVVIAAEPSVTKSPPLQIKSRQNAAFCVQRHCFFNGETTPRHTLLCNDLQYLPPGDAIILCACITKSLITGKSFVFGYEYPMLAAAIILIWIRILNYNTVRLFRAILDPRYQMSPSVGWNGHFKELFWLLLLLFWVQMAPSEFGLQDG